MSDDLISRQAAIDEICKTTADGDKAELFVWIIRQVPSAQPEPQWIPCSERLPEELAEVNVTWVNHDPEPYYAFAKDKPSTATAIFYRDKWYWSSSVCADILFEYGNNDADEVDEGIEVTAWMPLPEPYNGQVVMDMPTIEERKTGRWKRTYLDHEAMGERPSILYCSECNQCIAYPVNYCPNCGAKMVRGEEHE